MFILIFSSLTVGDGRSIAMLEFYFLITLGLEHIDGLLISLKDCLCRSINKKNTYLAFSKNIKTSFGCFS